MMRIVIASSCLALVLACKAEIVETPVRAQLRLVRGSGGRIDLELLNAPANGRALSLVLEVRGAPGLRIGDLRPAPGLALDTARVLDRGGGRTAVFLGDKRGVVLPRSGVVGSFILEGDPPAGSSLGIESAALADAEAQPMDVGLGASLVLR